MARPFPKSVRRDVTLESYSSRLSTHRDLLVTKGQFSQDEATKILSGVGSDNELTERAAAWLRKELATLRSLESRPGAVVRAGKAIARLDLSDLAATLLESRPADLGEELLCLFQELLDVDRHRMHLAQRHPPEWHRAAFCDACYKERGIPLSGVRELARSLNVSPDSVSKWRKSAEYEEAVHAHLSAFELQKQLA
jgi:hypothetical protein